MGEKNNLQKQKPEQKELVLNRVITSKDVEEFNTMAPIVITIRNTKGQDPAILSKLDSSISIRITGGFSDYKNEKYLSKTLYSPIEVSNLISMLADFEGNVDPAWSDLEKATYSYITLMKQISPRQENLKEDKKREKVEERPFAQILERNADSVGYAFMYKELLERLGVACRYYQKDDFHGWNEVLIDGEYYPADLFLDALSNKELLQKNAFELKNFLSDKEFYYRPEHQRTNQDNKKQEEKPSLEHLKIQDAIDRVLHPEKFIPEEIPTISLKSKEFQKIFQTEEIANSENFDDKKELRISFEGQDIDLVREDLSQIAKYYPKALENVTLANTTGTHVNMQEIVDTIYEGRSSSKDTTGITPSQIVIESSLAEDFDIDFSKAPEITKTEKQEAKVEGVSYSQKIAFVNTSGSALKLPDLSGKIPESIDTISIQDCDVAGFNIRSNNPITGGNGARKLELIGGDTHGISDIVGLDQVVSLSLNGLSQGDFKDVMHLAADDATGMPKLFDLKISNQELAGRQLFSEIKNPNIVELSIFNSKMNDITGLDALRNQLVRLGIAKNDFPIEDLKKVSEISFENPDFRRVIYANNSLDRTIDTLSGDVISAETYNYLDSYFRRSGYVDYRNLEYLNLTDSVARKRQMLKDFGRYDLEKVPYFIEDAEVMRNTLPYMRNPMMVKDLATFEGYLNDPSNYFEKDYLKDGILWLTKEQLDHLITSGKTIPQRICLKINTVSELSKSELAAIKSSCDANGLNLSGVNVFDDRCMDSANPTVHNFDEVDTHLASYDIDEYGKIREALDEIVDGITTSMTDAEKFAIVYHRIAQKVATYDNGAHGEKISKEHAIYQSKTFNKSRNLSEGLIEQEGFDVSSNSPDSTITNRCVCAGYADILKNALDLAGIQSIMDSGNAHFDRTQNKAIGGHEWNKVKIDGKWYYADSCWDAGSNSYEWALKGANTFEHSNDVRNRNGSLVEVNCHLTGIAPGERNEKVEQADYDQALLQDIFYRVKTGDIFPKYEITIPDDPDLIRPDIDINKIKDEYKRRKDDMLAKYYGDKDYQRNYDEIAARYRANEVEVTNGGITYRTVQDYAEREDDEQFLILGEYKNSLERMTRYEAGDTSVYSGTPDQIAVQLEKDKKYVETRNYTFDQHKNTQKDLATLGKFGETMPYIPKQTGIVKNGLRIAGNIGIFARNLVAPVYRFIGRNVAQPVHRLITGGKDASPYRNNPYHRFVARRDYFKDTARENDLVNGKNHPLRNYFMSNINAVAKYNEGNEAVLNAGAYDIQKNLTQQEMQRVGFNLLNRNKTELESQITLLENEIANHGDAKNIEEAKNRLTSKKNLLKRIEQSIDSVKTTGKIADIQTDAVSQTQHDIASKEVNTYRVAAIKGVAKLGIKKFVGPKIKNWLVEHSKQKVAREESYQTTIYVEKEVKNPSKVVPITEERPYYDIEVDDLIENAKGKTVKMYRSVSGGNKGEIAYTVNGNEACTGFHFQNGTKWGTGFSGNTPIITDQKWPAAFLDANNNLRDNITFSEIANAISSGELSQELLGDITLQIGNKGWVYAKELFEGLTKEVQVGTKVIEGGTHMEWLPEVVNRTKTVYDMVDNERVINALNTLGVTLDTARKVDTVHNAAEILRATDSDEETNKEEPRKYFYDDSEFYR